MTQNKPMKDNCAVGTVCPRWIRFQAYSFHIGRLRRWALHVRYHESTPVALLDKRGSGRDVGYFHDRHASADGIPDALFSWL